MNICLVTRLYPPHSTEGIPRQRQILANALAGLGHRVHVVTRGDEPGITERDGVVVHEIADSVERRAAVCNEPGVDAMLHHSEAVFETLRRISREERLDIVDAPLFALEALVTARYHDGPVALWLQTTSLHEVEVCGRKATPSLSLLVSLERECLWRATGLLGDSRSVLSDVERLYGLGGCPLPREVVHLGLPPKPAAGAPSPIGRPRTGVEALVVGRLETRKGTRLLLDILPRALERDQHLRVRFVGRDNSSSDGFQEEHGCGYAEFFRKRHPALAERVAFDGYVPERRLHELYEAASFVLAPSLYESFGLVFLEAMRSGMPVLTFDTGAASEVFEGGEACGAVLVAAGDRDGLLDGIFRLSRSVTLRQRLGVKGRERFERTFTAGRMAEETLSFYEQLLSLRGRPGLARGRRVVQVMEALSYGDAVSNICRTNAKLLTRVGGDPDILAVYADPRVASEVRPLDAIHPRDCLIVHYWNWSRLESLMRVFPGPKAIHFHSITPPHYFAEGSLAHRATASGYCQLSQIADSFDLVIGDSEFNLLELSQFLQRPKLSIVIYPVVDQDELRTAPFDRDALQALCSAAGVVWLYVARVARNKRQDRVMVAFDYYWRHINRQSTLRFVGDCNANADYYAELRALRRRLASREHITFTGGVSDELLRAHYRAADVYVSASEHEGLGIPLLEAAAFEIPVLANAAGAVEETLGKGGVLVRDWDTARVAEMAHTLVSDRGLKARVTASQRENLARFSVTAVHPRLAAAAAFLREGIRSPLIRTLSPSNRTGWRPARRRASE